MKYLYSTTLRPLLAVFLCACAGTAGAQTGSTVARLQELIDATPAGGWVDVGIGTFQSAWPTVSDQDWVPGTGSPGAIIRAWSSTAWDSRRGQLILWGGGHANYAGNEVYLWNAQSGTWSLGSQASRIDAEGFVVDSAAPQASHTYDNNIYLPVNDRFLTFGGGAWPQGGVYVVKDPNGAATRSGPWIWDPALADPNKVGGTSGSGINQSLVGGNMWLNRQGQWTGTEVEGDKWGAYIYGSTAYRTEGGKDVVYMSVAPWQSGFPGLYRYTVGNLATAGSLDRWEKIGQTTNSEIGGSAGDLDLANNLFARPSQRVAANGTRVTELAVWDLDGASPQSLATDHAITLTLAGSGAALSYQEGMALAYDAGSGVFYLFTGTGDGVVYRTHATFEANGALATTWVLEALGSTTPFWPTLNSLRGVYGKVQYIAELDAFMMLGEYDASVGDARVMLFKPMEVAAVPEPQTWLLMLGGVAGLAAWRWRTARA